MTLPRQVNPLDEGLCSWTCPDSLPSGGVAPSTRWVIVSVDALPRSMLFRGRGDASLVTHPDGTGAPLR
jgi:hypothetical protein